MQRTDALIGEVTFPGDGEYTLANGEANQVCSPASQSYVLQLMHQSRFIAASTGYAACVKEAIEVGLSDGWGPYVWQTRTTVSPAEEDPCFGTAAPCTVQLPWITERALDDSLTPNDVGFICDHLTTGLGYAAFEDKSGGGVEQIAWAQSNATDPTLNTLDRLMAEFPGAGRTGEPNDVFFAITAGGMWHEAMHQLGWTHYEASDSTARHLDSVPYLVARCMGDVGTLSQSCTETCPGDLRAVSSYVDTTCECVADPQPVYESYQRVRGRTPSRSELRVALDRLAQGTTIAELESSMRRVSLDRTTDVISVDGATNEGAWASATLHSVGNPVVKPTGRAVSPPDASGTWRATWNTDGLYLVVDVVDDVRLQDSSAQEWHLDDSIEIYVDADGSRATGYGANDFQFGIRPSPDTAVHRGYNSATPSGSISVARVNHTTDLGYRVEMGIPWSVLGVAPGRSVAMEVHINDDDGVGRESQLSWATNSAEAWKSPSYLTPVNLSHPIGAASTPTEQMTMDGIDNEQNWNLGTQTILRIPSPRSGGSNGTWKAFWSEDYLFLFARIVDSASVYLDGPSAWDDDSVEIYIDTDNHHRGAYDANDFQYVFRRDDPSNTVRTGGSSATSTSGILHETRNVSNGYTLEAAIPWGTLGLTPASGLLVGFDVHVNDDDNGGGRDGKRSWHSSSDESWNDTGTFGVIELTGDPPPAQVTLAYASQKPAIDGNGNDTVWPAGLSINGLVFGNVSPQTASWSGLWDYDNLYLRFIVGESNSPVANSGLAWWDDDSVELFLDPGFRHARTYDGQSEFEYIFRPGSEDFVGSTSAQGTTPFVRTGSDSTGYTIEMMIPWSQLGTHVMVGSEIGFDVHVNDDDPNTSATREGKLAWGLPLWAADLSWSMPQLFHRVRLGL